MRLNSSDGAWSVCYESQRETKKRTHLGWGFVGVGPSVGGYFGVVGATLGIERVFEGGAGHEQA